MRINERAREGERERDGWYNSFSNEIYWYVFFRGWEKTKKRCHHHHNEQYGTKYMTDCITCLTSNWTSCQTLPEIQWMFRYHDTLYCKPWKDKHLYDFLYTSSSGFWISSNFLLRQHNFGFGSWRNSSPEVSKKKPNKNHRIFVSCALIQILGGEGIISLCSVYTCCTWE